MVEAEWYRGATPEQREAWDATHPRGSDRPQIIPPAYPGAPIYEVVQGPNGAEVRRVGETGGATSTPAPAPANTVPPQVGEIRKGYRFKGGDPARKENWQPVQRGGATGSW